MRKKSSILTYALTMGLLLMFSTSCEKDDNKDDPKVVKDADGNVYKTITIGEQTWMTENLKTTKYNDGTAIPLVNDNKAWGALTTPAYCWHGDDETNKATYGALYNWHAVKTDKLCPTGWHVPDADEWAVLVSSLGGEDVAGGELKEAGTTHWKDPNGGANNNSGFTALPGGGRSDQGHFTTDFEKHGNWWAANESTDYPAMAWFSTLNCFKEDATIYFTNKKSGMSVRCIKDEKIETTNHLKIAGTKYDLSAGSLQNYGTDSSYKGYGIMLQLFSKGLKLNIDGPISGNGHTIEFGMISTRGDALDNKNYVFSSTKPHPIGTFDHGRYEINLNTEKYTSDADGDIAGGKINVSKKGDVYSITINCTSEDGKKVTGFYKGKLQTIEGGGPRK